MQGRQLGLGLIWLAQGCGTDAVGVTECREIEQARCAAASACGFPAVSECQRYYRDYCLHGVALESVNAVEVDSCVLDIERAGRCAAGQGPTTPPGACAEAIALASPAATICDVVRSPERGTSCAFLGPAPILPPVPPVPSAPAVLDDAGAQ